MGGNDRDREGVRLGLQFDKRASPLTLLLSLMRFHCCGLVGLVPAIRLSNLRGERHALTNPPLKPRAHCSLLIADLPF